VRSLETGSSVTNDETAPGAEAAGVGVGVDPVDSGADVGPGAPRKRHTARWIALSVLIVTAGLVAVLATRPVAVGQASSALIGKPAPGIATSPTEPVTTVAGTSFNLKSLMGRWVVVNFFASWCPPCQDEEPQLAAFSNSHSGAGEPVVLGIVYDDSGSNAQSFLRSAGARYTAVLDPGDLKVAYGVTGPPETFVVAPTGVVVAHYIGPVDQSNLNQVIAQGTAAGY
jgi:cytochrome c biogenesis protein CcmG, thiol:disulfide interchange protein DsbE